MSQHIKIRKGVNIKLQGTAEKVNVDATFPDSFAIKPSDFHGVVPKLLVKQGAEVKAGTPIFYDKLNEHIKFTSPVSGEVAEIVRGEKRKILEIKILPDKEIRYEEFTKADPKDLSREEILKQLLDSGCWPMITQRPFAVIANPQEKPKSIFISAFDSSPLAPDRDFIVHGRGATFQKGLDAIAKLTDGTVHLNVHTQLNASDVFTKAKGVQINQISGPHPSGNVGVQIHHIDPMGKGDVVWCLDPQGVLAIGQLFEEGKFDASRVVALTGSEIKKPRYYKTYFGAAVNKMLADNVNDGEVRFIAGNPLTGKQITDKGYIGYYDEQVTALPEGNKPQFFGWIAPGFDKFSLSRTFFSWLTPNKEYALNTSMNGEERAFVMTGQYEKVFPMDIYPVHLIKAIMIGDIEMMENLGIYEVAPEDFALCEYGCTSKINVQSIVRAGLDKVMND